MLRYLSFFNALATLDEQEPRWASVTAGLLVLRVFDDFVERGSSTVVERSTGLQAVRHQVEQLAKSDPQRTLLAGILREIELGATNPGTILPRIFAYARTLHFTGEWILAADVLDRVAEIASAAPPELRDLDLAMDARMQRAYCLRMQGHLDDAEVAYHEAGRLAAALDDAERALRARVGQAKIVITRGNLPHAAALLDDIIVEARDGAHRMAAGIALHDRAMLASRMGDQPVAARLLYEALSTTDDIAARDRVLADLATVMMEMGAHEAARDALIVVTLTSQHQVPRWQSELNLLELAVMQQNQLAFEQHRRALGNVVLPPELEAPMHLFVARGLAVFGRSAQAIGRELDAARAIAVRHGFHQIAHRIEMDAAAIARADRFPRSPATPLPDGLLDVAVGVRELREVVEAGG